MHLVHYNGKYISVDQAANQTEGLAVLGVFVEVMMLLFSALYSPDEAQTRLVQFFVVINCVINKSKFAVNTVSILNS